MKKQINFRVDADLEKFWRLFEFEEGGKRVFLDKLITESAEFRGEKPVSSPERLKNYIGGPVSEKAFKFWRDFKAVGGKNKWIRELIKKSPQFKEFKALN